MKSMPSRSELSDPQDWASVVLNGKTGRTANETSSAANPPLNISKNSEESEDKKQLFIGIDLKLAIQRARNARGLSQKELANRMNTQVQLINQYESGRAIPDNAFIAKMERELRMKLPRASKRSQ